MAEPFASLLADVPPGPTGGGASAPADLAELLFFTGPLTGPQLSRATQVAAETGEPLDRVITRLGLMTEAALASVLAEAFGLPQVTPAELLDADPALVALFAPRFLRASRLLPLARREGAVVIALPDPFDAAALQAARFAAKARVSVALGTATDIESALNALLGEQAPATSSAGIAEEGQALTEDADRLRELASDAPVIRMVNRWIAEAVEAGASDIHLEPSKEGLLLRHRLDGALRTVEHVPAALAASTVSRLKVMARLDIAERRLPQDGKIRLAVRGREVDIRVSVVPSIQGEAVALRILDRSGIALDLPSLGYAGAKLAQLDSLLSHPHGIVLVTGPTGSGKTTTLYAALLKLRDPTLKILTVEDPVEYQVPGAVQVQVSPGIGLGFAGTLRSFLRHDPDIILVGEIRDAETARIAIQAALTGHLVLSTLHTNDAPSAIARLVDMGVEDYLIAATLRGVVAQRLVRRLCPDCRTPRIPSADLVARLQLDRFSSGAPKLHAATGCPACRDTGYSGRIAIAEVLTVTDRVRQALMRSAEPEDIRAAALEGGTVPMLQDGLQEALSGTTSIEDVLRVTRSE